MGETVMESPNQVREAQFEDMSVIAEFLRSSASWYEPFLSEEDMSEHNVDDKWMKENWLKRDFFVIEENEKPVGTVSLQVFDEIAYIGYCYVDANQCGKGYGRQLLAFAAQEALSRGARQMVLISHPKAKWAVKAYLRFGFRLLCKNREEVLSFHGGFLKDYYEEGFELYGYDLRPLADILHYHSQAQSELPS